MQKKSGFGGAFFERFVHLYLAFVTMHKTYFEFLCKNSFALSTTLFHTFSGKYNHFFKKDSERVKQSKISLLYSHGRTQNGTHREKVFHYMQKKTDFVGVVLKRYLKKPLYYTETGESNIQG